MTAIAVAIPVVSAAIISAYADYQKLSNSHAQQMKSLKYQHDQAMLELQNGRIREDQRHQRLMKLLDILEYFVKNLGTQITEAECEGCKGLPGKKLNSWNCFQK